MLWLLIMGDGAPTMGTANRGTVAADCVHGPDDRERLTNQATWGPKDGGQIKRGEARVRP
jgi:hypothetical protein